MQEGVGGGGGGDDGSAGPREGEEGGSEAVGVVLDEEDARAVEPSVCGEADGRVDAVGERRRCGQRNGEGCSLALAGALGGDGAPGPQGGA